MNGKILTGNSDYPVQFSVDYPQRLSRIKTFFRVILVIPMLFVLAALSSFLIIQTPHGPHINGTQYLVFAPVLLILFRKKYPRWWFNWNVEMFRFISRVSIYMYCMRDEYPSTEDTQGVHLDIEYPEAGVLSRGMPFIKWLLATPHFIILFFLAIAFAICLVIGWFAVIFTGKYPKSIFRFNEGFYRWSARVLAYSLLMMTDRYPPFSFN